MIFQIRHFQHSKDFPMIQRWFAAHELTAPEAGMLPLGSTFVCEDAERRALLSVALLTTGSSVAWIEYLIGNPEASQPGVLKFLVGFLREFARLSNYRTLMALAPSPAHCRYYKSLGFEQTLSGLTAFRMGV